MEATITIHRLSLIENQKQFNLFILKKRHKENKKEDTTLQLKEQ